MKKILKVMFVFGLAFLFLTGCDNLMNTPTKKVELLLSKYQKKDEEVLKELGDILVTDSVLTTDQKDQYKKLMERQYSNLTYVIKNEAIDGKTAVVEVEIEVYDYNKAISESEDYLISHQEEFEDESGVVSTTKYNDYKLNSMNELSDRVKYTINFTLSKIDEEWIVDDLTDTERMKIHGLYAY